MTARLFGRLHSGFASENKAGSGRRLAVAGPMLHLRRTAVGDLMSVDYEVEYNNRARVPEHPQIFARWEREAAAYRSEVAARAELGLRYGSTARQIMDLFHPAGDRA